MIRLTLTIAALGLAGCGAKAPSPANVPERPLRVVSLDYCADQFALKLLDREQILAVSPEAVRDYSYMREAAIGVPTVRPIAEDVLVLKPDLVVRSYGGGPNAAAFFEAAGVPVVNVGWANSLGDIRRVTVDMADALGQSERGSAIVDDMDARLAAIVSHETKDKTLYMTVSGATTGPGSLIHDMMVEAGLENFETRPGWRMLPLEELAHNQPDKVAAAFFESEDSYKDPWSVMSHPVARAQLKGRPVVPLEGAWTSCSGWFLVDAIEALAKG